MLTSSSQISVIPLPPTAIEDLQDPLKPLPMGSHPDHSGGFLPESHFSDLPSLASVYTDVTVVPEHEKHELERTIANLEGDGGGESYSRTELMIRAKLEDRSDSLSYFIPSNNKFFGVNPGEAEADLSILMGADEILVLRQKQRLLDENRRLALNSIIDIKGSIRVFCRVRPFLPSDRRKFHEPVTTESEKIIVKMPGGAKEFGFDRVFPAESSQEDVFAEVKPILRSALDGHNVCVLAYGQTGTGKTFTMDGVTDQPGIVPRALEEIFTQSSSNELSSQTFSISMLEVYMGSIRDLLAPKTTHKPYETSTRCNLNIQTDPKGLIEIEGLTEVQISDLGKAKWWYNRGRRARSTSWTHVNEASSRSHCLTRIAISRTRDSTAKPEVSKLWMVDLGGSERVLKTGATGQTLDEGRAINLSLSALGDVIASLRRKKGHVPYRNSKLTQILKDSLGFGSKVLMLVHVSPCEEDAAETICSLSFAKRARAVESTRDIPEDLRKQREKRLAELEQEMKDAEQKCREVRDRFLKAEFLLNENKKLFAASYGPLENEDLEEKITTPKDLKQVFKTPLLSDKPIKPNRASPVPRFMTSTVASRQRQGASERDIVIRRAVKSSRSGTRSSVQFSLISQSFSYSDPLFKAIVSDKSSKKSRYADPKSIESTKGNSGSDSKPSHSMPKSKMVTSSYPNMRVALSRHRRRSSSLI